MDNSKIKSFLVYLVAVGIGIGIAKLGFDFITVKISPNQPPAAQKAHTKPSDMQPIPLAAAPQKVEPLANPPVKEKKPDSSSYILTGVYFTGDKTFALINNQIVEEGNEIGQAKVFNIYLDEVILKLSDNQTIKLTTRSRYP